MASLTNNCPSYQPSNFFVEHTGRLSSLLDLAISEANASTEPHLANDYQQLINVLRDLLSQAQAYSYQGPEEFRGRWQEVQIFTSRVHAVQDAIANWSGRLHAPRSPSKKRGRSETLDVEVTQVPDLKRSRSQEQDLPKLVDGFTTVVPIRPAPSSTMQMDCD